MRSMLIAATVAAAVQPLAGAGSAGAADRPNILFVILDDAGIDQFKTYGFGGLLPPKTPNIDRLATAGLKFTNAWGMPECSSSRATYFTGRYPSRTGVGMAIIESHLPQTYLSSFETTLPRVLDRAGYTSAMVGKYHLGNDRDPSGDSAALSRGWDAFIGNMGAGPPSIDKTAGGIDATGAQACGYFQVETSGACYRKSGDSISCNDLKAVSTASTSASRRCLQSGGIFSPGAACSAGIPASLDFEASNGYYVWPRVVAAGARSPVSTSDTSREGLSRRYMSLAQADDGANWWNRQAGPRMLTLSFNAMHTPYQKASTGLVPDPSDRTSQCNSLAPERFLLNSTLEGADAALGRAMAAMGLATVAADGTTITSLKLDNTLVVVVGDNGSFGASVRLADGFDTARAKGTVYQTGVWVPLIVSGGMVASPGRDVDALVNIADLFRLFTEVADIDYKAVVPPSHRIDGQTMLRYLKEPDARSARQVNYAELEPGTFTPDADDRSWPCVMANACSDTLFTSKGFCEDNGGVWYGPGATVQYNSCCSVANANPSAGITLMPLAQQTARTKAFKLVRSTRFACDTPLAGSGQTAALPWAEFATETSDEFYDIRKTAANPIGIDDPDKDKLAGCTADDPSSCLPAALRATYATLDRTIDRIAGTSSSDASCAAAGDGNMDRRISAVDLANWQIFAGKGPSRYDINVDGETDDDDKAIIEANMGRDCMSACQRADLDRNGTLDDADYQSVVAQTGACNEVTCSGDLDGDGKVNAADRSRFRALRQSCGTDSAALATEEATATP